MDLLFSPCCQFFLLDAYSRYHKKISKKKGKKINTLNFLILILLYIFLKLIFLVLNIAKLFDIKKICLLFLKNSKKRYYFIYILIFFLFFSNFFFKINGPNGLQIVNFLFSFILLFELCIKIAESERFINWIGDGLDKSIRYLIMFVISLNATYFFTRITQQIIESQNL